MPATDSRDRVLAAINHQQPDRLPIDFGATFITGLHCSVIEQLRQHYGLEQRPVRVHEPYQMLGYVEDDLKAALGIDTQGVIPHSTMFGFPATGWKSWTTPWKQDVLVPADFVTTTTDKGDVYIYPQGDSDAHASGHMPAGGYFFDAIVRQEPIDEDNLAVEDNTEEFKPLTDDELQTITRGVRDAHATGRAVVVCSPGTGLGDIALVPAPFLKQPKGIRDISEWYMSTAMRPDFVRAIFRHQVDIALPNLQRLNDEVGDLIDVIVICGTDFGTQTSQFCSVDTFRDLWLPFYREINDWVHANTRWKTFKHSCGAVAGLIDSFIDAGFDILNPVQCSATGMDPAELKAGFGKRITFWGGGIDTQHVLPFGTPTEVREQVTDRCRIFAQGGGFVFNTIHNTQAMTPVDNFVAMVDAVHTFNKNA
ncbi:uroporphyrinogen decarboxylase family protein [Mucisphaera calidilacus]|uniref:Methylcobalamin:coenzyme M methyltransferase n=1 Tax=Mucisphaera calidilacus TaxID=2527982 RepID=A0A518BYD4_9BACT|nr:uroporphyrinogen decarboxylase family protein [Mucisphaera calidilacus]QDU71990.1 methylcobalamin:coenzyme M methyltransferase [Mucisphaera calidilacus]